VLIRQQSTVDKARADIEILKWVTLKSGTAVSINLEGIIYRTGYVYLLPIR
jgi:hypothetical protein